jgi:hypothetical protein
MWEKDENPDEYYKHMLEAARAYKKSDSDKSPANKLTSEIVRWFEQQGGTARRVNTGGIYDQKIGKFRPSGMRRGFEDVDGVYPLMINGIKIGIKIACEVKIGRDKMTGDQNTRRKELEDAGGIYVICKTLDQTISDIHWRISELYQKIQESIG